MKRKTYHVYIMANSRRTIYIGVTGDLLRRVYDHKEKTIEGYTQLYNLTKLVYFEEYPTPPEAIAREKQLKGWRRERKIELIETLNSNWQDLALHWFQPEGTSTP